MLWKLQTLESGIHEFKALFCHWTSWVILSKLLFSFFSCKIEIILISASRDGCDDCMRWWMLREFPVSLSFPPTSTVCHPPRLDFSWQSILTPNTVNNRKERLSPTHLRFPDVPPYYSQALIYILPDTNYTVLLWTKSQHMKLLMALPIWLAILVGTLLLHGPISLQLQKSVIPSWSLSDLLRTVARVHREMGRGHDWKVLFCVWFLQMSPGAAMEDRPTLSAWASSSAA